MSGKRWFGKRGRKALAGIFCMCLLMAELTPAQSAYAMEEPAQYADGNSASALSDDAMSFTKEAGQETDKPAIEAEQNPLPAEEAGEEPKGPVQDEKSSDKDTEHPAEETPISDKEDEEMPVEAGDSSVSENTVEDEEVSVSENTIEDEEVSVSENTLKDDGGMRTMEVPEDAIASGTVDESYGKMSWVIDKDGKLTVEGTGNYAENPSKTRAPWIDRQTVSKIATAEIRVTGMTNAARMFYACDNLLSVDLRGLDTSRITNMESMFYCCYKLKSIQFEERPDTGNVTDMSAMFTSCAALENVDFMINFDTGNVTDMSAMFTSCAALENVDFMINFDTGNVTDISNMFSSCTALKNVDGMKNIDTGNVKNMNSLFNACVNLEQVDLSGWDTTNVTDMGSMFCDCGFRRITLGGKFTTRNVANMEDMFKVNTAPTWGKPEVMNNQDRRDLNGLDDLSWLEINNKKRMSEMFYGCCLKALDFGSLDTSGISKMPDYFFYGSDLTGVDFSRLKTDTITDMSYQFRHCSGDVDLHGLDTSNVTNMKGMFSMEGLFYGSKMTSLDMRGLDTSNVTSMAEMFSGCGLTSLDVSGFDTSNVTSMSSMFSGCSGLTSLDVSGFDTANVTSMGSMFQGCSGLTSLDVSGFDTANVTSMGQMFFDCSGLTGLDVSRFDTGNVTSMEAMFYNCSGLTSLDVSGFDTGNVATIQAMFSGCSALDHLDLSGFNLWTYTKQSYHIALPYGDDLFDGCDSLTKLYTPYNLNVTIKEDYWISSALPRTADGDGNEIRWYDAAGNAYEKLPALNYSIYLEKGNIPQASAARLVAYKRKTFYSCGEELIPDDLRVLYYGSDGTVRKLRTEDYTTNADLIDTSKPGSQTLTVTYTAEDASILRAEITLIFAKLLNGTVAKITLPDNVLTYDGKEKKPEPTVTYTLNGTSVTLTEGIDYTVSYRNNINAYPVLREDGTNTGAPTVVVKGMGDYSGSASLPFTIRKAAAPKAEELQITAFECAEARERRTINLSVSFLSCGKKTGYAVTAVTDEKNIFSKTPTARDISSAGVLTYGTMAAADGDTAVITIKVSFANYEDAELKVIVAMSLKQAAVITGLSIAEQTVYRGTAVTYTGTAVVKDANGRELTGMSLVYSYAGTLADGTDYPAQTEAPMHAGRYTLTVSAKNADYEGNATYAFEIIPAYATVRAKDIVILRGAQTEAPTYECETEGLLEGDDLKTKPSYRLTDEAGTAVSAPDFTKEGKYTVTPYGADAGADYTIVYESGILTVSDEGMAYTVIFDLMGHGKNWQKGGIKTGSLLELSDTEKDPAADGFVFAGWYKEKSFTDKQKWNFDTDTVQENLTLYACWLEKSDGLQLCVQEIPDLIYTGSALKPAVAVYDSDGETLLKAGKDYTVKYYKNTDAVAVGADGKPLSSGGLAKVTASGSTENILGSFDDKAPYVAITGKGSYTGTVCRNFVILPADISEFVLTYTDQFETKAGKTAKVINSIKSNYKKTLKADKDFTLTVQNADGQEVTLTKGQLPLNEGMYTLTVTGKGNYTGTISGKPLYVAAKAMLMKNASVTYAKTLPAESAEKLKEGIKQPAVTVRVSGKEIPKINAENLENYEITYADNDKVGTATMILTGRNGYVGTKTVTFKITGVSFSAKNVDVKEGMSEDGTGFVKEMTYTGKALTQNKVELTVKASGNNPAKKLILGKDYTISYKNNVKKGNATMIFTAKPQSGFSGNIKKTFRIDAQNLTETMFVKHDSGGKLQNKTLTVTEKNEQKHSIAVTWDEDAVYKKTGAVPTVILRNDCGVILKQGTDYTISCKNNKAPTKEGTSTASPKTNSKQPLMTIKGKGNYTGTLTVAYQIIPACIGEENADLWSTTAQVQKKDGLKLKDLNLKLFEKKTALKEGTDYTISDASGCTPEIIKAYADALGTAAQEQTAEPKVILNGTGNYIGTREISLADAVYLTKFTNNKNVTVSVVGDTFYTGKNLTPAVEVTFYESNYDGKKNASGNVLTEGKDYRVTYSDKNVQAGKNKGTVTVTGAGIYGGSVTVKFTIRQKQIYLDDK